MGAYEGHVCYVGHDHESEDGRSLIGGWHYTVVESPSGYEMPGERLVLEEDGSYRLATDEDQSHFEKHHVQYKGAVFTDDEQLQVTPEQMAKIKEILGQ